MKRLDANEMMDYVDGTLDDARRAEVEKHLQQCAEDRELISTMRVAVQALHELDEREPVRASDDFWMKVRAGLPAQAPRRSWTTQIGAWLWPQTSRAAQSLRVAVIAGIVALMGLWFAPQQSTNVVNASLPPEAQAFVQMATDRHNALVADQPLIGAPVGDLASRETGDEDDDTQSADGGATP
jgi:anti-sigma factor RsiW